MPRQGAATSASQPTSAQPVAERASVDGASAAMAAQPLYAAPPSSTAASINSRYGSPNALAAKTITIVGGAKAVPTDRQATSMEYKAPDASSNPSTHDLQLSGGGIGGDGGGGEGSVSTLASEAEARRVPARTMSGSNAMAAILAARAANATTVITTSIPAGTRAAKEQRQGMFDEEANGGQNNTLLRPSLPQPPAPSPPPGVSKSTTSAFSVPMHATHNTLPSVHLVPPNSAHSVSSFSQISAPSVEVSAAYSDNFEEDEELVQTRELKTGEERISEHKGQDQEGGGAIKIEEWEEHVEGEEPGTHSSPPALSAPSRSR